MTKHGCFNTPLQHGDWVQDTRQRRAERDNKVQMHVDLNEAYSVLLGLTHKLNLKAFNADLRDGRSFLSRMVDISDYPPT